MGDGQKKISEKENGGIVSGVLRPVSNFFCRIGLGKDDCEAEQALAGLVDRYQAFCAVQKEAAGALDAMEAFQTGPEGLEGLTREAVLLRYEGVSSRVRTVLAGLKPLDAAAAKVLLSQLREIDKAVRKALSGHDGAKVGPQAAVAERVGHSPCPHTEGNGTGPEGCRSLRDIVCFCRERARHVFFKICTRIDLGDKIPKQLVGKIPMQYWVVDVDDGIRVGRNTKKKVLLDDIVSPPLHALWAGLTAVPWEGPPPINTKGFLSVMFQCTRDPCLDPGVMRPFAKKNYIIVSKHFCNLTSRLGFHFATAEGFIGQTQAENYAGLEFRGGAACSERRVRRVELIGRILEQFGFVCRIQGDNLHALLEGRKQEYVEECLKIIGYLMTHTRQLDMVMCNDASVNWYFQEMLKRMAPFVTIIE